MTDNPTVLVPDREPGPVRARDSPRSSSSLARWLIAQRRGDASGTGRVEAGAHRLRRHPPDDHGRQHRSELHRPDRLDAHVLAGQDVDHRAGCAAEAVPASAHAGQRVAAVGRDRHGLHEPQPGRARRPRVRVHPDPARRAADQGRRARHRPEHVLARSALGSGQPAARPRSAACKLARFGDNMRDVAVTEGDKVEAQLRFGVSVNTYGVNDLVERSTRSPTPRSRTCSSSTPTSTNRRPSCGRAATSTSRCATAPASKRGCGPSSPTAASAPSPPTSRIWAGCGSCPASPCSG